MDKLINVGILDKQYFFENCYNVVFKYCCLLDKMSTDERQQAFQIGSKFVKRAPTLLKICYKKI